MAGAALQRVKMRVTGLVQGVFYRASTQERARSLGLTGWVRNTADGAVEIEAQGPAAGVAELVAWCRRGPPAAQVRDVEVTDAGAVREDERGFHIRR